MPELVSSQLMTRYWQETTAYKYDVYDKVATLHLLALGATLTDCAQEHAVHLGVKVEGPFKSRHSQTSS